jgi:hypothetical protein
MNTALYHKTGEKRGEFDKSPFHKIVWLKCPKCGEDFWFSCFVDSPEGEVEDTKRGFVAELEQRCDGDKHRRGFV